MCTFIAIATRDPHRAMPHFCSYTIFAASSDSLRRALTDDYSWFWLTDGHCACSLHIEPFDVDVEIAKIKSKYSKPKFRKRGWNDRRIADKIAGLRKTRATNRGGMASGLFDSLLQASIADPSMRFVINFYSGNQDTEVVEIFTEEKIGSTSDLEGAAQIRRNVLYSFELPQLAGDSRGRSCGA